MELDYGVLSCILFPGCSEENTTMEAADLLCTWGPSGPLPEQIPLAVFCPGKNEDKGFFEGWMDFQLHFAVFISKYVPSVLQNADRKEKGKCKRFAIRMIVHSDLFSKTFGCTSVFPDFRSNCPPDLSVALHAFWIG